jgi:osmotically-inducible protein OsmY
MTQTHIQDKLERALEQIGVHAAISVDGRLVTLTGEVDTEEAVLAAEEVVRGLTPDCQIDNNLEVQDTLPVDVEAFQTEIGAADNLSESRVELDTGDSEIEPSFTDQPLITAQDDSEDQDESHFAPTDPVIEPGARENIDVVGGFSGTSLDQADPLPSASDGRIGDEALEEAVRQMLISDASTTDLNIRVSVRNGTVILEGSVAGIEDAENAEAVANSVRGVREVVDRLDVAGPSS